MKRSVSRILTTHVGSLPRPNDLLELYRDNAPDGTLLPRLQSAIADVVRRQTDCGVDVVNDGEFGKAMRRAVDYGAWWSYVYDRLAGFELRQVGRRERPRRVDLRQQGAQGVRRVLCGRRRHGERAGGEQQRAHVRSHLYGSGEICWSRGDQARHRQSQGALAGARAEDAFMTAVSPATLQILPNEHYKNREDYTWALAEAIHEEYKAIVDAGFIVQIDDPALVDIYDWWFSLNGDMAGYRKWAAFQVEAVNHALEGIPEDRVRFHICWGSWHGPHNGDVPLKDVVDLLLKVKAQGYSVEAGNVRHEHEWKVFRDVKVPDGKVLIPGVVSHATNVLEHPEVVADRLMNYASVVGRENVIASTDCGLGGRIHPQLAWAKLKALREGADLASKQLWK